MNKLKKLSNSITDLFRTGNPKFDEDNEDPISIAERYPLHNAAVFGNSVEVEFLLSSGRCHANQEDDKGRIPLHYSVQHHSTYISQLLIKHRANVDSVDYTEATPAHFAAKEGEIENSCLLLSFGADFCSRDKMGKTALDVAAEEGHIELIKFLIKQNCLQSLLLRIKFNDTKTLNTPLHLAARNGHVEIIYLLLNADFPINLKTSQGTALHEAVKHGRLQVVRLLLHLGIDYTLRDSYDLTAEDYGIQVISRNPVTAPVILELLQEAHKKVYGIVIRDFFQKAYDPLHRYREGGSWGCPRGSELPLKAGELVWILESPNTDKLFWRGIAFSSSGTSRCGYFPRKIVKLQMGYEVYHKKQDGKHPRKIKKVNIPMVPEMATTAGDIHESAFNLSNTTDYHTDSGSNASDRNSFYTNSSAPLPGMSPTPSRAESIAFDNATVASFPDDDYSCSETVAISSNPMSRSCSTMMQHANSYGSIAPNYSMASTDSYHSGSGFNSARSRSQFPNAGSSNSISSQYSNQRSSSSCMIDKSQRDNNLVGSSRSSNNLYPTGSTLSYRLAQPVRRTKNWHKVAQLITKGVSEMEILAEWLNGLGFSNYLQLFVSQGYDLASIARVTPQDLIALGITQPNHRRVLIQDIHEWNITDGYPSYVPSSNGIRDFLSAIGLSQYIELLESQKYTTIKDLEDLSWEDLEDVGVKKLGHMKRLCIALKKIKTNREARQRQSSGQIESQQMGDYHAGTLTSRSSTSLGDRGCSFTDGCNTLRKPSRMSVPETRQRPVAPVLPSHHISTSSENIKLPYKELGRKLESESSGNKKGHHFALETRKPATLNLIMKDQILSKLDDIENDDVLSTSMADDIPPSPAPISSNGAIERLYALKTKSGHPHSNYDFYPGNYQVINGSSGLPVTHQIRYHQSEEPYINDIEHLNDLGQMLRDLTDELDAKLKPCGSTAV